METLPAVRNPEAIFDEIHQVAYKVTESFVPSDGEEQKNLFLSGAIDAPKHHYDRLATIDYEGVDTRLATLGDELAQHPTIPQSFKPINSQFIEHARKINNFVHSASVLASPDLTSDQKAEAKAKFMADNKDLYGDVEQDVVHGLLSEKVAKIAVPDAKDVLAQQLYTELLTMLPSMSSTDEVQAYKPSAVVMDTMQRVVDGLCENVLEHIPLRTEPYVRDEIRDTFDKILRLEFEQSALGWMTELTKGNSVHVNALTERIQIPENMKPKTAEEGRALVSHELVHLLRAVMASETDMYAMKTGLPGYYDAEEGIGMVMQQAVTGKYVPPGTLHYITAGLLAEGYSFRQTHDIRWRLEVLKDYTPGSDIDEAAVAKARDSAYNGVRRITRGTDELPWFKDLAYYRGNAASWQYFEKHCGDELMLSLALLGKIDPTNKRHIRAALESSTP